MFVTALNKLISDRDDIISNFELLKDVVFDTTNLDNELAGLQGEMAVVAEMVQKCVSKNANTRMNQKDYRNSYEGLVQRFETAKVRFSEVTEFKRDKAVRREMTEAFIAELRERSDVVSEFDERLWHTLLDYVTVYSDTDVRFTFRDGTVLPDV